MKLEGKAKMLRIHFGEDDKWHGKPLYRAIVEKCRELDIAGATVYRGVEGYGASTLIHKAHLLSSSDRPIMVSVVDTHENISKFLPALDQMVNDGLIAISDVEVIKYVHQDGVRSPASWRDDEERGQFVTLLGFIGATGVIETDAREFLTRLVEVNTTRVQSDILNRIQASQAYLEVEIRKLLHEVSRAAEQALNNARTVLEEWASSVEAAKERLGRLEQEVVNLRDVPSLRFPMRLGNDRSERSEGHK